MEPSNELMLKLRQRRTRMGEEASLTDIVNTLPEQDASAVDVTADVKVKQRRCVFENAENRPANAQSAVVGPGAAKPERVWKPWESSANTQSATPVADAGGLQESPLASPSRGRTPLLRIPSAGGPGSPLLRCPSAENSVWPLSPLLRTPSAGPPASPLRRCPPLAGAASAGVATSPDRAGAKMEDAIPPPAPEIGRRIMEVIGEESPVTEAPLTARTDADVATEPPLTARSAELAEVEDLSEPAEAAEPAEPVEPSEPDEMTEVVEPSDLLANASAEAECSAEEAAESSAACARFFAILDDSIAHVEGEVEAMRSARSSKGRGGQSSRCASEEPAECQSAAECSRSKSLGATPKERRQGSPGERETDESYEPMEYVVLDYFQSLPPGFVEKLRESLEYYDEEVRQLRSENRRLRNDGHSTPSPRSRDKNCKRSKSTPKACDSDCGKELEALAREDKGTPQDRKASEKEWPTNKLSSRIESLLGQLQAESQIEPVTVWQPRIAPVTEATTVAKPAPTANSVAAPPGPPGQLRLAVDSSEPGPCPSLPSVPALPQSIGTAVRQVIVQQPLALPGTPASALGSPTRHSALAPASAGSRSIPAPQSSPSGSRASGNSPPQLPTWRAAPTATPVPRTLSFEASVPHLNQHDFCRQRSRDERAEVSGAQAQISQLFDALKMAKEKCKRQDAERWALVNEAMRELAQLPEPRRATERRAYTPDTGRRAGALCAAAAASTTASASQLPTASKRMTRGMTSRSPSADHLQRKSASPLASRRRACDLGSAQQTAPRSKATPSSSPLRRSPRSGAFSPPSRASGRTGASQDSSKVGCIGPGRRTSPKRSAAPPPVIHAPPPPSQRVERSLSAGSRPRPPSWSSLSVGRQRS